MSSAPSALGNAAEISPIRNTTPATGPRYLSATSWKNIIAGCNNHSFVLNINKQQGLQETGIKDSQKPVFR